MKHLLRVGDRFVNANLVTWPAFYLATYDHSAKQALCTGYSVNIGMNHKHEYLTHFGMSIPEQDEEAYALALKEVDRINIWLKQFVDSD